VAAARTPVKGFTLIELLIAVVILSMVVGLGTLAFSLFTQQWARSRTQFDDRLADFQRMELVHRALEDAIPWAVRGEAGKIWLLFPRPRRGPHARHVEPHLQSGPRRRDSLFS